MKTESTVVALSAWILDIKRKYFNCNEVGLTCQVCAELISRGDSFVFIEQFFFGKDDFFLHQPALLEKLVVLKLALRS